MPSTYKHFADPIHGFIAVPRYVLLRLILTPEVQRLRRIRQLGVGFLVFPCAEHTRFSHALGAMALMGDALKSLADKGTSISQEEHQGALAATLLHDIGHGPFSHSLESTLIEGVKHDRISCALIDALNKRDDLPLDLALSIFNGTYERGFFHDLVSSQLDVDRLDYLRRDSHFTGVAEGRIGVERIIKTMRVHPIEGGADSCIAIESKGIYAVESVLIARRLMYWQVYLHKTVLAGDHVLLSAIGRARSNLRSGKKDAVEGISPALRYFLESPYNESSLEDPEVLQAFTALDDADVLYSLKRWMHSKDKILADLSRRFIQRDLFRCVFLSEDPGDDMLQEWKRQVAEFLLRNGLSMASSAENDADYYLSTGHTSHSAYARNEGTVWILDAKGVRRELAELADTPSIAALRSFVKKPFVCYPKEVDIAAASL